MEKTKGKPGTKIWLIGDSAPEQWEKDLAHPFDERHPVIHNIWTPIVYKIQRLIYDEKATLISDDFYIRNAVEKACMKPKSNIEEWDDILLEQITDMQKDIETYKPQMIITFGAFAFEFVQRAFANEQHKYGYWTTERLGQQFVKNIKANNVIIPLLHRSISGGHFLKSHQAFTGGENENYFEFVAQHLYEKVYEICMI